jgi:hypothetical protein
MSHTVKIDGREVDLEWTQETAKRYAYRMGELGGEPTGRQLSNPRTVTTALFKVLWALLPAAEFVRHADPESLFVAVDHETEGEAIFTALAAIYRDRSPDAEKKSTSLKSPSPESNSE